MIGERVNCPSCSKELVVPDELPKANLDVGISESNVSDGDKIEDLKLRLEKVQLEKQILEEEKAINKIKRSGRYRRQHVPIHGEAGESLARIFFNRIKLLWRRLFSFKGRIGRLQYLYAFLAVAGILTIIILLGLINALTGGLLLVLLLPFLCIHLLSVQVRRLHDLNISGFWLIPFIALGLIHQVYFRVAMSDLQRDFKRLDAEYFNITYRGNTDAFLGKRNELTDLEKVALAQQHQSTKKELITKTMADARPFTLLVIFVSIPFGLYLFLAPSVAGRGRSNRFGEQAHRVF